MINQINKSFLLIEIKIEKSKTKSLPDKLSFHFQILVKVEFVEDHLYLLLHKEMIFQLDQLIHLLQLKSMNKHSFK